MKTRVLAAFSPILIGGLALLCLAGCSVERSPAPLELTILATGDVRGYVDPCG